MSLRVGWTLVCDGGLHRTLPRAVGCFQQAGPPVSGNMDSVEPELQRRAKNAGWKSMRPWWAGELHLCPRCAELNRI